jgi:hypothetical protein
LLFKGLKLLKEGGDVDDTPRADEIGCLWVQKTYPGISPA